LSKPSKNKIILYSTEQKQMKVLVACEFSGIVRDAFKARGHDAWSCDLLPTEKPGQHIQGDVLEILGNGWDLMIAHPPCTYLSYVATRSWNDVGRCKKRLDALEFFRQLWEAPIDKICVENPQGCASPTIAKYSQIIQPWYFGEPFYKTTCLWLKNLSLLIHLEDDTLFEPKTHTPKPKPIYVCEKTGKNVHWNEAMGGSNRAKSRSIFWCGIADAMAEQWG
jgi:hypothetical protein